MKKVFCLLFSTLALAACQKREIPAGQPAPSDRLAVTPLEMDTLGEPDPIANTEAVPGGTYLAWSGGFPKSLNMWLDYNSFSAEVMGLLFERLVALHSTKDEPVGVLARSWETSPDGKTFTFHLDPRARWSDGKPVIARDVQFYYDVMMNPKNMTPVFRVGLKRFDRPQIVDDQTLRVTAHEAHWANFWEAADLAAFPSHVWESKDFNQIHFDFPVTSGPYAVEEIKKERYVTLKRREDWWGRAKPYNRHKYNFDRVKYRFMEDQNKALEAFRKGDFDVFPVYTASIWSEKTRFDEVKKGWVARHRVYNREPKGFQGFALNLRRGIFQDERVRRALCHLFNRKLMNDKLMYNEYFLLNSFYPDLYPGNVNPDVPLCEYDPEKARTLLGEAGWNAGPDGVLMMDGARFEIVFSTSMVDLRHHNVYLEDLKKVGIAARIEQMSQSTLSRNIDRHDFDIFWTAWGASRLRDPEPIWHSSGADQNASSNYPGIMDPAVDSLIQVQKTEMNLGRRNDLLRRLDARLMEIQPYVLMWQIDHSRLLYWQKFGTPKDILDKFGREEGVIPYWFMDPAKEKALRDAREKNTSMAADTGDVRYSD